MESPREEISKQLDHTEPLSEVEIDELATALRRLSTEGLAVPKNLLRHAIAGEIRTMRHDGYTHDAIPAALDQVGADREEVVVGLIRRFEQVVREHHDQVSRERRVSLDKALLARYFGLAGPDAELEMFAIAENDEDKLQAGALDGLRAITPCSARLPSLALRLGHSDKYWVRVQAQRGEETEDLSTISYASPETLLAVARIFSHLGLAARPAIPLIEDCAKRPYVAGASNEEEWQDILKAIEKR